MTAPLLLATRSGGKLRELKPMFAAAGISVIDLAEAGVAESPDEDGIERFGTFEENALAKARYFHAKGGLATIADDSGLEVAALGGAPGVRSKRWSGRTDLTGQALDDANNAALLAALAGKSDRRARYVCVAAFVSDGGELTARGVTDGTIVDAPAGAHGFGYDPYFVSRELGVTFGEATRVAKEAISHRGRAFRALIAQMTRKVD
ncbi:MAG TPA: non-canonical purine NTP pyrophosphatase [Gemmatimonadaceae bacterium]|nr:non-canonical purine NTP pyrophosphatase [Gemmatimonadaceae bacterium]